MTKTKHKSSVRASCVALLTLGLALAATTESGFAARGVAGSNGSSGTPGGGPSACAGGVCGASAVRPPRHYVSFSRTDSHCWKRLPLYDADGDLVGPWRVAMCW